MMSINGHLLNLESHGQSDGIVVILLHHGLGAARSWKEQIPALVESGFRVIAYDRWGYGKSSRRARLSMPGFEDDLADLEAIYCKLHLDRAALVGHSDGANIAMQFTARHLEQVTCLVVIAPHIYVEPKMAQGMEEVRQAYETDLEFQTKFARVHRENAKTLFWNWYNGWRDERNLSLDMRPVLKQIACPSLVIQGLADEHASPHHARDVAATIPGAELWLVPDGKHMLPQDLPTEFNSRLADFLLGQSQPSYQPKLG